VDKSEEDRKTLQTYLKQLLTVDNSNNAELSERSFRNSWNVFASHAIDEEMKKPNALSMTARQVDKFALTTSIRFARETHNLREGITRSFLSARNKPSRKNPSAIGRFPKYYKAMLVRND